MRNFSIIIGIVLSVIFFIAAFAVSEYISMWTFPKVDKVSYVSMSMNDFFIKTFIFATVLGLTPITTVLVWRFAPIVSVKRRIIATTFIIGCIFLAGLIRYLMILSRAKGISRYLNQTTASPGDVFKYVIPVSEVNIEMYMLGGLIAGAIIVCFLFRQKKNKTPELSF